MTLHGGVKVDEVERPDGYRELGAETMKPLLGRGVLLDVAGLKGVAQLPQNYAITADDLDRRGDGRRRHGAGPATCCWCGPATRRRGTTRRPT